MAIEQEPKKKVVFLSAITSDIGIALAQKYSKNGYIITGTYRSKALLPELTSLPDCYLCFCDLADRSSIKDSAKWFAELGLHWGTLISCAVWPPPLTNFFNTDFEEWSSSVHVNAIEQLRVLHAFYPFRNPEAVANVVFFAGPGTNNAVKNFSAVVISKIILIKMCELLDFENEDMNVFIVGPGWTKTKTHNVILADPHVSQEKYTETLKFMQTQEGTSMEDIYDSIRWLSEQGRQVAGGRNFSIVHDYWATEELAETLKGDLNMYKLRRYRNNWKDKEEKK